GEVGAGGSATTAATDNHTVLRATIIGGPPSKITETHGAAYAAPRTWQPWTSSSSPAPRGASTRPDWRRPREAQGRNRDADRARTDGRPSRRSRRRSTSCLRRGSSDTP